MENLLMNPRQLLVADVMTIDPIVVVDDSPIAEAARLIRSNSVSGLPVVDRGGSLVGVISQTDLLALQDTPIGRIIRAEVSGLRTGELMSSPAITVSMSDSLGNAARLMRDNHVHRLVALDESGRPIGVLSTSDFVGLFADS
jgi:CBS domain-containing protein